MDKKHYMSCVNRYKKLNLRINLGVFTLIHLKSSLRSYTVPIALSMSQNA